jgi:LPS export ABC transporter protein LptC
VISENSRNAILVLAVLVSGSFWISRNGPEENLGPTPGLDLELDYALSDFEVQSYDLQGQPAYRLRSPRFTSDASTGQGRITDPQIDIHHEGYRWHIIADAATVTRDRERVQLEGEVDLFRQGAQQSDWLAVTTSEVTLEVTPRVAWSTQYVELMDAASRMTATGFSIDMLNNNYRLQEDVKGNYAIQ